MYKKLIAVASIFLISSCAASRFNGYAPTNDGFLDTYEWRGEGYFLSSYSYSYYNKIGENAGLHLDINTKNERNYVEFYVVVNDGSSARLESNVIKIVDDKTGVINKIYIEAFVDYFAGNSNQSMKLKPTSTLTDKSYERGAFREGRGTSFRSVVGAVEDFGVVDYSLSDCITVKLPNVFINGEINKTAPFKMKKMKDGEFVSVVCD